MPGPAATAMLVATRLANKLFCTVRIGLLPYVSAARQGARTGSLAVFVRTDRVVLTGLLGMRSDIDTTPAKLPTGRNSAFRHLITSASPVALAKGWLVSRCSLLVS